MGYETIHGHCTRTGTIFRSGNLDRLPPRSQDILVNEYGIKTILDLRSFSERERYPDVFACSSCLRYQAIPLVDTTSSLWHAELRTRYQLLLLHCQEALKVILEAVAISTLPLIMHCTAGKDRTGLVVALLLSIACVPETRIVGDYALSGDCLASFFNEVRQHLQSRGGDIQRFERDCQAHPDMMRQTLLFLHHRFGGIAGYLQQIGVSESTQRRLYHMLVYDG